MKRKCRDEVPGVGKECASYLGDGTIIIRALTGCNFNDATSHRLPVTGSHKRTQGMSGGSRRVSGHSSLDRVLTAA
jgi:hypothetical protein